MNTRGLQLMHIDEHSPDPTGGRIGREEKSNRPNGYLEETAFTKIAAQLPRITVEEQVEALLRAEQIYLQHGITTAQEGLVTHSEWEVLEEVAERQLLTIDIVGYVDMRDNSRILTKNKVFNLKYRNHIKLGGYKIFLDGSPQSKTAWMQNPYEKSDECGYGIHSDQDCPILPPNMMKTIWCAVNRISKKKIEFEQEKISAEDTLCAITATAAYQYGEEEEKGTIAVEKRADLVVLDRDPRKVDPLEIDKILVLETIKDGKTVYRLAK